MNICERIVEELSRKPMSVSELAKRLNLRREFLTGYLEAMRQQGLLERVVVGRAHVYIPKQTVSLSGVSDGEEE